MMRHMPPTDTRPLVDRIMGGTLDAWLRDHADLSQRKLAAALRAEWDLTVSSNTLARWVEEMT